MGCSSSSKVEAEASVDCSVLESICEAQANTAIIPKIINESLLCERISWRRGDLIGTGANGRVYLGLEEVTGAIIAVKEVMFTRNAWVS